MIQKNWVKFVKNRWNHCTSAPHRSETNGIADRGVRMVKEGTSAILLQSGLDEHWRSESTDCYFYLRNVQGLLPDGKTPSERRFGEPFCDARIPFVSMIEYRQISAKENARLHQLVKKKSPHRHLRWQCVGCGWRISKGDICVADVEELKILDASEVHGVFLGITFIVITFNQGSNFLYRRKGHSQFHSSILMLSGGRVRHWIFGGKSHRRLLES